MHRALVIPEILEKIAVHLYEEPPYAHSSTRPAPKADWIRLCRVCKVWWQSLTRLIWRVIVIKRVDKAEALQKCLEAYPHLGEHVHSFKLWLESPRSAGLETFCHTEILKACPNIKTLSVNGWAGASARRDLKKAMSTLHDLERLEISRWTLSDDESEAYGDFEALLLQCMHWRKLRVLSVQQRTTHPWNGHLDDLSDDENDPEPQPPTTSDTGGWDRPEESEYTDYFKKSDEWHDRRSERLEKHTAVVRAELDRHDAQQGCLSELNTLHFGEVGLTDDSLAMLARMAPNIKEVKINDNPDKASSSAFSAALDAWSHTLRIFYLEPNEESPHQISDALSKCSQINDLTCSEKNCPPAAFAEHFPMLQRLTYELPDTKLPALVSALKASKSPLRSLQVSSDGDMKKTAAWTELQGWADKNNIKVKARYSPEDFEEHWGFSDWGSDDSDEDSDEDDYDDEEDDYEYGDSEGYNDQFSDEFDEE